MDHSGTSGYGLWILVVINSIIFMFFAWSFAKPQTKRDWRSFGAFSAFLVALFAEMYGFPLTIYLLSGWLGSKYPGLDLFSHDVGHLWNTLFGIKGNPHFGFLHLLSNVLIITGFLLVASAWRTLYKAQQEHKLAVTGAYSYVRHPQYLGFILVLTGFLFQWPTLLTLLMYPILVVMYIRLAKKEEKEVRAAFGAEYDEYADATHAFIPGLRKRRTIGESRRLGTE